MTTNKPEVVAWIWDYRGRHMATTDYSKALELSEPPYPTEVEPLIRLADYQRLQADLERLQAECEKLRKDAERYQWLRSHDRASDKHEDGMGPPGTVGMVFVSQGDDYAEATEGDDLDAAIDAAMQGDQP